MTSLSSNAMITSPERGMRRIGPPLEHVIAAIPGAIRRGVRGTVPPIHATPMSPSARLVIAARRLRPGAGRPSPSYALWTNSTTFPSGSRTIAMCRPGRSSRFRTSNWIPARSHSAQTSSRFETANVRYR